MCLTQTGVFKIFILLVAIQGAIPTCFHEEDCVKKSVKEGIQKLTIDLLNPFSEALKTDENLIYSGINIFLALAGVDIAAYGLTHEEIEKILVGSLPSYSEHHKHYAISETQADLQNNTEKIIISIANGIFIQYDKKLNEQYKIDMKRYYNATTQSVDFFYQREQTKDIINQYVAKQTKNLIPQLLSEPVDKDVKVLLAACLYFKADWEDLFLESNTEKEDFTSESGKIVPSCMMKRIDWLPYLDDSTLQAQIVGIPYSKGEAMMYVLLPHEGRSIRQLVNALKPEDITKIVNHTKTTYVDLWVPRFENYWSLSINEPLQSLGIERSFSDYAEFDFLDDCERLKIYSVIHAAKIKTHENGTEAAAVTVIAVGEITSVGNPPPTPVIFHANRAFLYFIRHVRTETILFLGIVNVPEESIPENCKLDAN